LAFVSYGDRKVVAAELKGIYRAADAQTGETALAAFEAGKWGAQYPAIAPSWRRVWGEVVPFYAFSDDVRRIVYTNQCHRGPERQAQTRRARQRPLSAR
jgi:putative transposase